MQPKSNPLIKVEENEMAVLWSPTHISGPITKKSKEDHKLEKDI